MNRWIAHACLRFMVALPATAHAQASLVGVVTNVWADPVDGRPPVLRHYLTEANGTEWILEASEGVADFGSAVAGERWIVRGAPATPLPALLAGDAALRYRVGQAERTGSALLGATPTTLRYLILRCLAADASGVTYSHDQLSVVYGKLPPRVGHFLHEMSEGQLHFEVVDIQTVTLPSPQLAYGGLALPGGGYTSYAGALNQDCVDGATAVDWDTVDGVAMHMNWPGGAAFGGQMSVTLNGQSRVLRSLWMPTNNAFERVVIHEVGHSIGWSHSGSDYGAIHERQYDNPWDVMGWVGFLPPDATQTPAVNRAGWGWIPPERRAVVQPGEVSEFTMEIVGSGRVGPRAAGAVDFIEVISPNGGRRISAEPRHKAGPYDRGIPFPGVVLHRLTRPIGLSLGCCLAKLVDPDGNGVPWDDGPALAPGERYEHPDGLGIEVLDSVPNGYRIRAWSGWPLTLTVRGPGAVDGVPGAPACNGECRSIHATAGSVASLVPSPTPPANFRGWTGDCTGSGACSVPLDRPSAVTAWFGSAPFLRSQPVRPYAAVGRPYDDTLRVDTEAASSFAVTAADLPAGLTLAQQTGRITGTPTAAGIFRPIVTMTALGQTTVDTVSLRTVAASSTIADSVFLLRYEERWLPLPVDGGGPLGRSARIISGSLHDGLRIGEDGAWGGIPFTGGVQSVTVGFELPSGPAEATYHVVVLDRGPTIETTTIPGLQWVGRFISTQLRVQGNDPVTWAVGGGDLPPGITLTPIGQLLGQFTVPGQYTFSAEARRGTLADTVALTLGVEIPSLRDDDVATSLMRRRPLSIAQADYVDFIGNRNNTVDLGDLRAWLRLRGRISGGGT